MDAAGLPPALGVGVWGRAGHRDDKWLPPYRDILQGAERGKTGRVGPDSGETSQGTWLGSKCFRLQVTKTQVQGG